MPVAASNPQLPSGGGYVEVPGLDELAIGEQRTVILGVVRLLICRSEQAIHAVDDLCPHALQPLSGGEICNGTIRCPKHGALFDLSSGRPLNRVTGESLKVYPVRIRNGRIEVATAD